MNVSRTAARAKPSADYPRRGRECAYANLKLMSRAIGSLYDEVLKPSGLRASELALLWAVVAQEPVAMSRLATTTLTDATTLSRTVQRLSDAGLVDVEAAADRRVRMVSSTVLGRRRFRGAMPHWEHAQAIARKLVPVAEVERLARHVRRARRATPA